MPRPPKPKLELADSWTPDLDRIFKVVGHNVIIGGNVQDPTTVQNLKSEASMFKRILLFQLLGNTIANEAAKYALEKIDVSAPAEVRSSQLAFAQALSMWNKHVWTNVEVLSKL